MAAGEGFEPSHTESESAVLPLHNPAMFLTNIDYYTDYIWFVKPFFNDFYTFIHEPHEDSCGSYFTHFFSAFSSCGAVICRIHLSPKPANTQNIGVTSAMEKLKNTWPK